MKETEIQVIARNSKVSTSNMLIYLKKIKIIISFAATTILFVAMTAGIVLFCEYIYAHGEWTISEFILLTVFAIIDTMTLVSGMQYSVKLACKDSVKIMEYVKL